ncbi:MFS transporter [bacterium]|nr:MFS transporter [bacterium]
MKETIAKKSFGAGAGYITAIAILVHAVMVFSIFFGYKTRGRSKAGYYFVAMLLGRAVLFTSFLITDIRIFIVYIFLFFSFNSIVSPGVNAIMQSLFDDSNRGKFFSKMRMAASFTAMLVSYGTGRLLDISHSWFLPLFIAAGLLGSISFGILIYIDKKIKYRPFKVKERKFGLVVSIFKKNREFLKFESLFMVYGFGFMAMLPLVPEYLIGVMGFSYSQMGFVKGPLTQIFIVLFIPLAGAIYDRTDPWYIFRYSLIFLLFYPLSFLLVDLGIGGEMLIYAGFLSLSLGLAGITLVWSLGSIFFAKDEDSTMYQSIHVALTGIRGLFGPTLSFLLLRLFGFRVAFGFSFLMFLLAFIGASVHHKRKKQLTMDNYK